MRGGRGIATIVAVGAFIGGVAVAGGGVGESDESANEVPDGPRMPGLDLELSAVTTARTAAADDAAKLEVTSFYVKNVHGQDFGLDSGDSSGFTGFCVYSDDGSQVGAGIEFPTGAVITSISAHFDDTDAASNASVTLYRLTQSGTGSESFVDLAAASSSGSAGNQEVGDVVSGGDGPGGAELVGDNEFFHLNLSSADPNERMCGVEIFYNLTEDVDSVLVPIEPTRVYDSRQAQPQFGPLGAGQSRVISVADGRDPNGGAVTDADIVPDGATAIAYNLTVTDTVGAGFLSVTPGDAATFKASTINWASSGLVLANAGLVKLDSSRQIKVFGGTGSTDFIIDITGYYL